MTLDLAKLKEAAEKAKSDNGPLQFHIVTSPAMINGLLGRLKDAEAALDRIAHECTIRRDGNAVQTVADMKAIASAHMEKHNG